MNFKQDDCGRSERRDCTVRATAACLNIPYTEAQARLSALGRKKNCGVVFERVAEALGLELCPEFSCRTLKSILPEMTQGRFIVRKSGHTFAVVDGVVIDIVAPKELVRVKMAYREAKV